MITTVCLNTNSKKFTENCVAAEISELKKVEGNIIWADVSDPTSRDFEELAEEFGFHHLSIEDCQNAHQRPKVEALTLVIRKQIPTTARSSSTMKVCISRRTLWREGTRRRIWEWNRSCS